MKRTTAAIAALLLAFSEAAPAQAQPHPGGYWPLPHGGYVYQAPQGWPVPPPYYRGYGLGYGRYSWRALPPYGFGSPYYNGYNNPYYYSYGPGVREFLRFGGADFYGW
jgi:hypothetical protein